MAVADRLEQRDDAEAAGERLDWHDEHRARLHAGDAVDLLVEALVGESVVNREHLAVDL
jgi:hypothetical protein